ncbi:MAG TPA: hypothetical protein VK154_12090 [Chitinophagales bacterium]|nr:hypothetical protein [Chitinophagales bacterium]
MKSIFVTITALCLSVAAYAQTAQQPTTRATTTIDYTKPEPARTNPPAATEIKPRVVQSTNSMEPVKAPANTPVVPAEKRVRPAVNTDATAPATTR